MLAAYLVSAACGFLVAARVPPAIEHRGWLAKRYKKPHRAQRISRCAADIAVLGLLAMAITLVGAGHDSAAFASASSFAIGAVVGHISLTSRLVKELTK